MRPTRKSTCYISNIVPEDTETWEPPNIFFTLDLDWAPEFVVKDCLHLLEHAGIKSTWYITENSSAVNIIRKSGNSELGIHPNFNPLLFERGQQNIAEELITNLCTFVPEARSVRSHSLTQNSRLLKVFSDHGIRYELNTYIQAFDQIRLKPFRYHFGMIKLPYLWQDDSHLECGYRYTDFMNHINSSKGLTIINFHPIHLYLNTERMDRYTDSKQFMQNEDRLSSLVNRSAYGIRNFFEEIVEKLI